jgi:hypothetical protein
VTRATARCRRVAHPSILLGACPAGDVCYNPSRCVHAVRNTRLTVSLTHNYVDASNLADVLTDAVRDSVQD